MRLRPSSIAIGAVWLLFLFYSFRQGWGLPASPLAQQLQFDGFGRLMLLLPFVFFVLAAFFQRHKQFTWPVITRAVDARFGEGAFARFLIRLRPIALFALACFALGGTGLISTHLTTQATGAYVVSGFFLSGGLGLLTAYCLSVRFPPRLI
jgi:hypothetical protein